MNMETIGTMPEGEFYSFNGVCPEEADFMAKLLGNCSLPSDASNSSHYAIYSSHWPTHEPNVNIAGVDECSMYSDETNNNIFSFSQESNHSAGNNMHFPDPTCESYYPSGYNNFMATDSGVPFFSSSVIHGEDFLNQDVSNDSVECDETSPLPEIRAEDKVGSSSELSKKRPQIPREDLQKSKRSVKNKKCPNNYEDNKINNNSVIHKRTSSSCSEDGPDASHENSACNLSGKTRASRGSATDPQSLYARKRRERINERLRILQNLVPNGTKVDISTMLEEAVQYVKFLQLQIKLLSSDDHWMYAPIAYNGMDIGLDRHLPSPTSQS